MNEITMIPVGLLEHHPENPRKDLGDLTELTASIKKNGIMQNLTVVPDMDNSKYLVVIGNRRLEAAKAAGLIELPCAVKDLDHKTQIATMLEENMQRADLTVYEQAQGFQMMMDLGYSAADIAEKTGFGETTVRRRIKMAEMDAKLPEEATITGEEKEQLDELTRDGMPLDEAMEEVKERLKGARVKLGEKHKTIGDAFEELAQGLQTRLNPTKKPVNYDGFEIMCIKGEFGEYRTDGRKFNFANAPKIMYFEMNKEDLAAFLDEIRRAAQILGVVAE